MKMFKRNQKGFTLIELLVVISILGILAAVVVPNVGRFLGRGESEAAKTELHNVQTAVMAAMVDNGLSTITPVTTSTNDMSAFPGNGIVLYPGYVTMSTAANYYTVDAFGTVTSDNVSS